MVQVSSVHALVSASTVADVSVAHLAVLVSYVGPPSRWTRDSELTALVSVQQDKPVTQVSEAVAVVSYVTGSTAQYSSRAWGFSLDNHHFYVLHLGEQGTFVFDSLSGEWAQWITEGYNTWNMEHGIEWEGEIFAGDRDLPTLWKLDTDTDLDGEFRAIRRVVTGGIPATGRDTLRTGMFVLSASPQATLPTDIDEAPKVTLSISDDRGSTFTSVGTLTVDSAETQDLAWKGLGVIKAPGRVFKVEDVGGLVRIDGADQKIEGEKESGQ